MNWDLLLKNQCPKCGAELDFDGEGYTCTEEECEFYITEKRYEEIKKNLVKFS
jgi:tRNA(Ile2) C34 agmatinyltransferase TiaS